MYSNSTSQLNGNQYEFAEETKISLTIFQSKQSHEFQN